MKVLWMLLGLAAMLGAVEVEMRPVDYRKNELNIEAFDLFLKNKMHFKAENKADLDRRLHENWVMANDYYKNRMTPLEKAEVENLVNRFLSEKAVSAIQHSIRLSEDILRSYYLDHLHEFKYKPLIDAEVFSFKKLEDAFDFYKYSREHNASDVLEYAKRKKIDVEPYKVRYNMMLPAYRLAMRDLKEEGYFTPPFYYERTFEVMWVKSVKSDNGYVPFEKVKKRISDKLYKQTYLRKRKEILEKLMAK